MQISDGNAWNNIYFDSGDKMCRFFLNSLFGLVEHLIEDSGNFGSKGGDEVEVEHFHQHSLLLFIGGLISNEQGITCKGLDEILDL